MLRILFVALALISAVLPAQAVILTLSCEGTVELKSKGRTEPVPKMGVIVDLDAGTVTGFAGIIAQIEKFDATMVLFGGDKASFSVFGSLDRVTGATTATVIMYSRDRKELLMNHTYSLICKPTKPLF